MKGNCTDYTFNINVENDEKINKISTQNKLKLLFEDLKCHIKNKKNVFICVVKLLRIWI